MAMWNPWPNYAPIGGLSNNFVSPYLKELGISGASPLVGDRLSSSLSSIANDPSLLKTIGANANSSIIGESGAIPASELMGNGMDFMGPAIGAGLGLAQSLVTGDLWKHPLTTMGKIGGSTGGALGGAALGSMLAPGPGTVIGGSLGSAAGGKFGGMMGK